MKNILIIITFFIVISCSNNDLTRNLAKDIIKERFNIPCVEIVHFQNETLGKNKIPQKYIDFINEDYISYDRESSWNTLYYLTRKSLPYYNQDRKIIAGNLIEFNEVTGIKFNDTKNLATVNFTLKRKDVTPFGKFGGRYEEEILEKNLDFELYDDGWRIVQNDLDKNFTPKDLFGLYNEEFMKDFDEETRQIKIESENQGN